MAANAPMKYSVDDLTPDILAGIGKIIAWWGYLQLQLGVIIREVTNVRKETGYVLTIGPDLNVLCTMIKTLTHSDHWIKDAGLRNDLAKFGKDVRDKSDHRNDYAHGVFGYQGDNPRIFVRHLFKSPPHRITPGTEPITPASLGKISDEARDLWLRAQDITHRLKALKRKRP